MQENFIRCDKLLLTTSHIMLYTKAAIEVYGVSFRVGLRAPTEKAVDTNTHATQEVTEGTT